MSLSSNLRAHNGEIISEAGNINIKNGINSIKSYITSKKKGTAKSSSKVYDYQKTALMSSLAFNNDLKVNAELGDVNFQGSTLNINNDLSLQQLYNSKRIRWKSKQKLMALSKQSVEM